MSEKNKNEDFFVTTMNKTGYMTKAPDEYSEQFIEFAADHYPELALEIGAAYGVTSHIALAKGANMIVNDLDHRHIKILIEKTLPELRHHLHPVVAKMPDLHFIPGSLIAILACRILHFLSGPDIRKAFADFAQWLKPGGRVFIVAETPYIGTLNTFESTFIARLQAGEEWPGYIDNTFDYWPERAHDLPPMLHPLDPATLAREAHRAGLLVTESRCFARPEYPEDMQNDGRESVGLIAIKP